jgi:hypothetical protein
VREGKHNLRSKTLRLVNFANDPKSSICLFGSDISLRAAGSPVWTEPINDRWGQVWHTIDLSFSIKRERKRERRKKEIIYFAEFTVNTFEC